MQAFLNAFVTLVGKCVAAVRSAELSWPPVELWRKCTEPCTRHQYIRGQAEQLSACMSGPKILHVGDMLAEVLSKVGTPRIPLAAWLSAL